MYFILDNVPNIKTHDNGQTWKGVETSLHNCNYQIQDFILSPHDFGVPHKRGRIFIVGVRNGLAILPRIFLLLAKMLILMLICCWIMLLGQDYILVTNWYLIWSYLAKLAILLTGFRLLWGSNI